MTQKLFLLGPLALFSGCAVAQNAAPNAAQKFDWQTPHAKVLPTGDLEYAPQPFRFRAGATVRYIDFQSGNDQNDGASKTTPWKHHPWDANATGNAKNSRGPVTYVFKRGTIYRGALRPNGDAGTAQNPIQLTSDPSWGAGEAAIYGSQTVSGWTKGAHPRMPEGEKVWRTRVNFLPRNVWMTQGGQITRLKLARHPNWTESDPYDVMSEWPTWENPRWWQNGNRGHLTQVDGKEKHLGIDTKNLTGKAEDYVGGTVWSEWGIVMGSPYPAKIEAFDEKQKAVAFRGPWTYDALESIIRGNRYYLEDRPQWLDEGGEFWLERNGNENGGTLFLRLPKDADPNGVTIEAARHVNLIDAEKLENLSVSGLSFRFSNTHWDYNIPFWAHPDLAAGVIRLNGSGNGISVKNNVFEHVNLPVRFGAKTVSDAIDNVEIADNVMRFTDQGAITIGARFGGRDEAQIGKLGRVEILRNNLQNIGWRIISGEHGHAVDVRYPTDCHIAGNFLSRVAGWGLSVFGGKPSGNAGAEVPFFRNMMHHNRVEDVLLKSNDWGGIETWQGGPHYVWNNVVKNPVGFKNWIFANGDKTNPSAFGHAYYMDGSFKNYVFNNIALGRNNTLGTKSVNVSGLQGILGFENWFFHNTFSRFAATVRQQAPEAGRLRYLSNVMDDSSQIVLRIADPKKGTPDPNASHYSQGGAFDYPTLALKNNVFSQVKGDFGVFEETGVTYKTLPEMSQALQKTKAKASQIGVMSAASPFQNREKGDVRPVKTGAANGLGTKVFVPWSLSGVVGEWSFNQNQADPTKIEDEHWLMSPLYADREKYRSTPRYPLRGQNISASNYGAGTLENWTNGALSLDGKTQFLRLAQNDIVPPPPPIEAPVVEQNDWVKITRPAKIVPGGKFEIVVELLGEVANEKPRLDLHYNKKQGFGGFLAPGGNGTPVAGSKAVKFSLTAPVRGDLSQYLALVYVTPTGKWEDVSKKQNFPIEPSKTAAIDPNKTRTVDIASGNFLIEAVLQTSAKTGTLVRKMAGGTGYHLDLTNGAPRLIVTGGGQRFVATASRAISDGKWHHIVVEVDRKTGATFSLDGQKIAATTSGVLPTGSLSNTGDFLVGGGENQAFFSGKLDFLRVARGTLADAKTSIGELYAWQFNGPQTRDFAGRPRTTQNNAAGALLP